MLLVAPQHPKWTKRREHEITLRSSLLGRLGLRSDLLASSKCSRVVPNEKAGGENRQHRNSQNTADTRLHRPNPVD